jgi:TRAP-type C4-dicarboxylate transport system permease small subunit
MPKKYLEYTILSLSGLLLVAGVVLEVANLILRAFGHPINGTYEMIGWLIGISMVLGMSYTQLERAHVNIDGLVKKLPRLFSSGIESGLYLLATIAFAFGAKQLFIYAAAEHVSGSVSQTLHMPVFPLIYVVAVAVACFTTVLGLQTIFLFKVCVSRKDVSKDVTENNRDA